MTDDMRFALVLRATPPSFPRDFPFEYGVCFVEGETARTAFVDFDGLEKAIGDFPCVPSTHGRIPGIISFDAEMQAIDTLSAVGAEFSTRYSIGPAPGYHPMKEMIEGGLRVTVTERRIAVEIAEWVLSSSGLHAGDRVSLCVRDDGIHFSLYADRDGAAFAREGQPGWLATTRDWPLPLSICLADGEYSVPFAAGDDGIFFAMPPTRPSQPSPEQTGELPAPPLAGLPERLPIDYRWVPLALAAVYFGVATALKFI